MRHILAGTVAGIAAAIVMTVGTAPAMACYGACAGAYSYDPYGYGCGAVQSPCGGSVYYAPAYRQQLPDPTGPWSYSGPQYYYVNQGPLYSGPGNVAPAPTYQERAVSGWYAYGRPYYYGYYGGPYANTTNHLYDGANAVGPAVYSYRWNRRHGYAPTRYRSPAPRGPKYYYTSKQGVRYGSAGPRTQRVN
jgi:hypothetical protein